MEHNYIFLSSELGLEKSQIENTYNLYKEGATIAFIARYRKELTKGLDEDTIRNIIDRLNYLENLDKRKEEVIRLIEEQGKLTEELKKDIESSTVLQRVEDLYLPYKKKKKTKADIAKEQGLEELSKKILEGITKDELEILAKDFITDLVVDQKDAIEKASLIIAQDISEDIKVREYLREQILEKANISASLIEKNKQLDENLVYKDYYEFTSSIKNVKTHNVLALNRAEKEKILKVSISFDDITQDKVYKNILNKTFKKKDKSQEELYLSIVVDAYTRLLFPSIENEVRNILTTNSDEDAIKVFSKNLESLLLQPPLYKKTILGLDPGIRTGCKLAIISSEGFYVASDVIYPVDYAHSEKQLELSRKKLKEYIQKYKVDIIAIGNGTASRETEKFVAENIKGLDVKYVIVNEAGASVYSASKLAAEEFPKLDVTVRGTISIARRIQDPLSELVKIDPKSIGVGMYQHDVNQKELNNSLEETIVKIVNRVGVNLNTASYALLSFVSGVKKNIAKNIVDYRKENGDFKDRQSLLKVKGLGAKAYEQMAGFIVIPESKNPFDNTIIHPESYELAQKILELVSESKESLYSDYKAVREKLSKLKEKDVIEKMKKDYGVETIKDVYNALLLDRRDPRDSYPQPMLKSDILNIEDLKEGMELEAVVRNVAKFGAFVDIGLKNDAMIHISELSDKFVKDPSDILSVGDIIKVRVLNIDKERKRVALSRKNMK
ncbi:helix-hairpin-helix domain-containing protein [Oceanivirga miroungae]|uniref:RNA binding S1 domain-containing protein n=1 Tax=Oceanivirga miroungae TaxID=1130046 RepID=A0A6I8MDI1_9FUSO|nr:Tex family protein [Oceanivirga miroungae]VWL85224.1 RNA binding S1 domain-containing protein [Oceanivirga miroungae]